MTGLSKSVFGQQVLDLGALPGMINRQNYGYMLKKVAEVRVATHVAKMVFHVQLPVWNITFDNENISCKDSEHSESCERIQEILDVLSEMRMKVQKHVQTTVKHIHEVVRDLPIGRRRQRRGILTNFLGSATGLATYDQLQSLRTVLDRVQVGIHRSVEMFGKGSRDLVASFKLAQNRFQNINSVLHNFRKTIKSHQTDLVQLKQTDRTGFKTLCALIKWLRKAEDEIAETDRLYTALQILQGGEIPHFIISHEEMNNSLVQIERHLQQNDDHMTLVRHDYSYYYNTAVFQTFISPGRELQSGWVNYFTIAIDTPLTTRTLRQPFLLYEVMTLPLPTPESDRYYNILSAEIKYLGFNRDLDVIMQVEKLHNLPIQDVWLYTDAPAVFMDRSQPTCAAALIAGVAIWLKLNVYVDTASFGHPIHVV